MDVGVSQFDTTGSVGNVGLTQPRRRLPAAGASGVSLDYVYRLLIERVLDEADRSRAQLRLSEIVEQVSGAAAVVFFHRDSANKLTITDRGPLADLAEVVQATDKQWLTWCSTACQQQQTVQASIDGSLENHVVAVPVLRRGGSPEGFCAVFLADNPPTGQSVELLQTVSTVMTLWQVWQEAADANRELTGVAAVLELCTDLAAAASTQEAAYRIVNEIRDFLGCERVALAMQSRWTRHCRLRAVSGLSKFDKRSSLVRAMEAAMDEAILADQTIVWTDNESHDALPCLAHRKFAAEAGADCIISGPLRNHRGELLGAWLLVGDGQLQTRSGDGHLIRLAGTPVGATLGLLEESRRGVLARLAGRLAGWLRSRWLYVALIVCVALAAIGAYPIPYRLACDCVIEPVSKRFVTAPFEGSLEKSLVEPGDLVEQEDALARMDAREIRWELAGLEADYNRAAKEKDAALAARKTSAAQIVALEMEQLQLKIKLLEHRMEQLEIRSPIDGIVVTGDLERVEGAPLSVGQTLFEIAPLDRMIVEVAVPENEIAYAADQMRVDVRLDSYPGEQFEGRIERLHPRSEIREDENIFVAEVHLENTDGRFRPGMKGRAKIESDPQPIAWILFHRPIDALTKMVGW